MTFESLFDDAALFPPGNAPMEQAVEAHLARRATKDGIYVGPFVCPVERLDELGHMLAGRRIDVSVVGMPDGPLPAGAVLSAVELRGPLITIPDLPDGVRVFVERSWEGGLDVPPGAALKLRCGGTYVPSACQLGLAIVHCVENAQPFKLTAGLHHAIRTDHEHGLLNVFAAVEAALHGDDPVPMLLTDDPNEIKLSDPGAVRQLLMSVGTCSIDEPVADLRKLWWLP